MRRGRGILLGLGIVLGTLSFGIAPAGAAEYGNIGGRPANPDPSNPRSQSIFIHTIAPGTTRQDAIKVMNYTNQPKTLLVYATDSIVSSGGAFGCAQLVDEKKGVGSWVSMGVSEVHLQPNTDKVVPFTITAPAAADVGENDGCIVVQEKDGTKQTLKGEDGGNIALSFRTAIRLIAMIPGEIQKQLKILGYAASRSDDGNFLLKPRVKNNGNVSLDTEISTVTSDLFGRQKTVYTQQYPILRNATSDWNIPYERPFWGGWMKSHFTATYDANVDNSIGQTQNQNKVTLKSETITFFSPPAGGAAVAYLLLFALLAAAAYWAYRRYYAAHHHKEEWETIVIDTPTDIVSLAGTFGVSWRVLARRNKIKAPYILKAGDVIKVPPRMAEADRSLKGRLLHLKKLARLKDGRQYIGWESIVIDQPTDIVSLAQSFGVSWKMLAKANNLKAPYILKAGDVIKVPPTPEHKPPTPPKPLSSLGIGPQQPSQRPAPIEPRQDEAAELSYHHHQTQTPPVYEQPAHKPVQAPEHREHSGHQTAPTPAQPQQQASPAALPEYRPQPRLATPAQPQHPAAPKLGTPAQPQPPQQPVSPVWESPRQATPPATYPLTKPPGHTPPSNHGPYHAHKNPDDTHNKPDQ